MGFMGFGQSPDAPSLLDQMHTDRSRSPFYTSLLMVADALRFDLEDVRYTREVALEPDGFDIPFGRIAAGTDRRGEDLVRRNRERGATCWSTSSCGE